MALTKIKPSVLDETDDWLYTGNMTLNGTNTCNGNLTTSAVTLSGHVTGSDKNMSRVNVKDTSLITVDLGSSAGGNFTINLNNGHSFQGTISVGACTISFTNPTAADECTGFVLKLLNGGSQTVTWPAAVDWPAGSAPTLTAAGTDIIVFLTWDAGVTWHGKVYALDSK